jgi:hypothetical protein
MSSGSYKEIPTEGIHCGGLGGVGVVGNLGNFFTGLYFEVGSF